MSEAGYVELPIMQWLSGHGSATPDDNGLGWTYRDEAAMAAFDRPLEDPLVEKLLVAAILRINDHVKTEAQAKLAVDALRKTMTHPDKLTANRETLDLLRDGAKVELAPGEDATTVHFIAFDPDQPAPERLHRHQPVSRAGREAVPGRHGAAGQRHSAGDRRVQELPHQRQGLDGGGASTAPLPAQAPLMLTPNVFCVAADEESSATARCCSTTPRKEDIERHLDTWGPWLSHYPERKGWWNEPEADQPGRSAAKSRSRACCGLKPVPRAGLPPALHCLRDEEGQDRQEDRPLPAVRGGERHRGPHAGADRQAVTARTDRPHLAHRARARR